MSTKHPDVLVKPPCDLVALTLAEMHVARWILRATCPRCALELKVSLPTLIRIYGPDAVWWGKRTPCPRFTCDDGQLVYSAQAIRGGSVASLGGPPSQIAVKRWEDSRGPIGRGAR